jgi:hypothetical protein
MRLVRSISMVLLSDHYPPPVLMSLTVYKRFKFYRRDNSPLVATVYRDGVIYMLCMACKSRISMNSCRQCLTFAVVSLANCLTGFMLPVSS